MNTHQNQSTDHVGGDNDRGFTLVEILIAIVLVGILSVVVIVGISNLTSTGSKSACTASLDSAKASTVAYYAGHANQYPADFTQLAPADGTGALVLPSGAAVNTTVLSTAATPKALADAAVGMAIVGPSWQLTMKAPATAGAAPTFVCAP
jgi:prepilin-type N-terminal cleavage/methylation domain-containing protein